MQSTTNNVSNETERSVKFTYNEEIRRFTMKSTTSLDDMICIIRYLIGVSDDTPLKLKYLDDENEWVVMEKDIEFAYALTITGNPVKLTVELATLSQGKGWKGKCQRGEWKGKCKRGEGKGRGRNWAGKETETCGDSEPGEFKRRGRGGRGKQWRKYKEEKKDSESDSVSSETSEPGEFKRKGRGGRGKQWKKYKQEKKDSESSSSSEHSELKEIKEPEASISVYTSWTADAINAKINDLVQHKKNVLEQLKAARESLSVKKENIKQCRQIPEKRGEIPALRISLNEAKASMLAVRDELLETKSEIKLLKEARREEKINRILQ